MDKKKSYVMFRAWTPMFLKMDDAELGKLMKDICRYHEGEDVESDSPIFELLKQAFNESNQKYNEACEAKRKSAIKGVLKRSTPEARKVYIADMDIEDVRSLMDMTSDSPDIQKELAKRMIQHKSAYATKCRQVQADGSISQHYEYEYENEYDNDNENEYGFEKDARENLHPYGERQNVYLTDKQYFSLAMKYGNDNVMAATNTVGYTKQANGSRDNEEDYRKVLECLKKDYASCRM